jgi:DNA-binding response OmpR family regulator
MIDANKITVLVVDDDPSMRAFLLELLSDNGFVPIVTEGGEKLDQITTDHRIDIVLMDLRLKGESGLTLAKQLQQSQGIPIIMLTGIADEVEKIVGLEVAVDDYIMKPFNPRELIARIRAVLRRAYGVQVRDARPIVAQPENSIHFGDFSIDFDHRLLVDHDGKEIQVTNTEFRLLEVLINSPNKIFSRQELLDQLGADYGRYIDRTIDVFILRLRRKIERTPTKPVFLQTRRGRGYEFVLER